MKRNLFVVTLVALLLLAISHVAMAETSRLITQSDAARHGLKRAWFAQVRIDPGKARISYLRLFQGAGRLPDTLFVQTDQGVIHALNAETGQTLWVRAIGNRNLPTMALGANDEMVGVINGTHLYLLDRFDGRILWTRRIDGVPAEGVVVTDKFIVVPTLSGQVIAYPIAKVEYETEDEVISLPTKPKDSSDEQEEETESAPAEPKPMTTPVSIETNKPFALDQQSIEPLTCVSFGRVTSQPIFLLEDLKNQYLAWSTTKGLFVGYVDLQRNREFPVSYQLRTNSEIVTQPTYLAPTAGEAAGDGLIFSASKAGHVHAIIATRGIEAWYYAVGQPIAEPIAPIVDRAYVVTQLGGLFCLDAATGRERWSTTGVGQFVAASRQCVYVADRFGQIRVLDSASGAMVDGLFAADLPIKFQNLWTDRLYMATPTGLIQCLHESAQAEPLRYRNLAPPQAEAAGEIPTPPAADKPEEKPTEEESPFGESNEESDKDESSPFDQ